MSVSLTLKGFIMARTAMERKAESERIAQEALEARKREVMRRSALRWALSILTGGLAVSIAANILSVPKEPIPIFTATVAPVSLFAATKMFMLLGAVRIKWAVYPLMSVSILIAGWSSYWHIFDLINLNYGNGRNIAYLTPISIDIPMLLAGVVWSYLKTTATPKTDETLPKTVVTPKTAEPPVSRTTTPAKRTTPAKKATPPKTVEIPKIEEIPVNGKVPTLAV